MEWPELPGISIDVGALLRQLGPDTLIQAVKAAAANSDDQYPPAAAAHLHLRVRGIALDVNAPELLRSLEPSQVDDAVRMAADPWPLSKRQLLQDELPRLTAALGCSTSHAGNAPGTESSLHLPLIGAAGRPPRLPGTTRNARGSSLGDRSVTWAALPKVTQSTSSTTLPGLAAPQDRGDAKLMGDQLRRAIRAKDLPKVETLIASRADVEAAGSDGSCPTTLAMAQGTPHGILKVLFEAKADVNKRDGQGRSLAHLWSWTLPKSRQALREEQKKLALLVRFSADLNAKLQGTGDTPLHVVARVFNALSMRIADGPDQSCNLDLGDAAEAEKFVQGTQFRIQLLVGSNAEVTARNNAGRKPLDLVERRFWPALVQLASAPSGRGTSETKGHRVRLDTASTSGSLDTCDLSAG